jgi:hypothetical protein
MHRSTGYIALEALGVALCGGARAHSASADKIPYRPGLRHLALVAVCAKRLSRHPAVGAISGTLQSSRAVLLGTDSSTCICIILASSALSPSIDDQSASGIPSSRMLAASARWRVMAARRELPLDICACTEYCAYLSVFKPPSISINKCTCTYRCTYRCTRAQYPYILTGSFMRHISLQIRRAFFRQHDS